MFLYIDNWKYFKTEYPPKKRPKNKITDIVEQVEKMLGYGDPRNSYSLYICVDFIENNWKNRKGGE